MLREGHRPAGKVQICTLQRGAGLHAVDDMAGEEISDEAFERCSYGLSRIFGFEVKRRGEKADQIIGSRIPEMREDFSIEAHDRDRAGMPGESLHERTGKGVPVRELFQGS